MGTHEKHAVFKREVREMMEQLGQGEEELSKWVKSSKSIDALVKLPGDASTRSYYRVTSGARPGLR